MLGLCRMWIIVHQGYLSRDVLHLGRHVMQHSEHVASGGYPSGAVLVPAGTLLPFGRTTPLGTTPHNPPTPAIGYSPCPEPCAPTPAPPALDCTGLHRTAPHRSTKTPHPAGPSWQSRVSLTPHTRTQLVHLTDSSKPPQGCVPPALFGGSRRRWVSLLTSLTFGEWQAARGVTAGVKVSLETGPRPTVCGVHRARRART